MNSNSKLYCASVGVFTWVNVLSSSVLVAVLVFLDCLLQIRDLTSIEYLGKVLVASLKVLAKTSLANGQIQPDSNNYLANHAWFATCHVNFPTTVCNYNT